MIWGVTGALVELDGEEEEAPVNEKTEENVEEKAPKKKANSEDKTGGRRGRGRGRGRGCNENQQTEETGGRHHELI